MASKLAYFDKKLFLWINEIVDRHPIVDYFILLIGSDYLVPMSLTLVLVGLWFSNTNRIYREQQQIYVFIAVIAMALSSLSVLIINSLYARPRPFEILEEATLIFYEPTDPSFPSNAAASVFAICLSIWPLSKKLSLLMIIAGSLMVISRTAAGVHYPSDVIAGIIIATMITFLVNYLSTFAKPILTAVIRLARIFCCA